VASAFPCAKTDRSLRRERPRWALRVTPGLAHIDLAHIDLAHIDKDGCLLAPEWVGVASTRRIAIAASPLVGLESPTPCCLQGAVVRVLSSGCCFQGGVCRVASWEWLRGMCR